MRVRVRVRVGYKGVCLYIYGLAKLSCSSLGLGQVLLKLTLDPNPLGVSFLKPKPNPTVSQVGYPWVKVLLPFLLWVDTFW